MDDPFTPEWIQREQALRESDSLRREAERATERAANLLIKANGPLFGKGVLSILEASVKALPKLGMNGSINQTGTASRVYINKPGSVARFSHTDVFLETFGIRCNVFGGGCYELRYCAITDSEIGVIGNAAPMDQEQVAEHILRFMMRRIE